MLVRTAPRLAVLALVLSLAACGGSDETSAPAPKLPRALAADLAAQSDQIADTLAAGDECAAAHQADALQAAAIGAINAGDVPPALQEDLQATANELVDAINCPPPKEEDDDKGKDENGKKGKDGGGDEDTVSTTTLSVTTTTTTG